jgi:hypothetical protein
MTSLNNMEYCIFREEDQGSDYAHGTSLEYARIFEPQEVIVDTVKLPTS